MSKIMEELNRISLLESICKNPITVDAINNSYKEDADDSFGIFDTPEEAFAAMEESWKNEKN